ncbi:MAG: carboxymuconolactone decarboxylase family protein [Caldilineaceae bacterium]|nr:carboxymuconolactone decarboxylase family protein [Caldilineaceae bacterium]
MSRLKTIRRQDFTPAQEQLFHNIATGKRGQGASADSFLGPEGGMRGPFNALLYSPILGDAVQRVGEAVRYEGTLPGQLRELAILTVAGYWQAKYEWWAHANIARKLGMDEAIIAGVEAGALPDSAESAQHMIFDFARELLETHHVSDARYTAAVEMFSESMVAELVILLGYYTLISMTLNVFEVAAPEE